MAERSNARAALLGITLISSACSGTPPSNADAGIAVGGTAAGGYASGGSSSSTMALGGAPTAGGNSSLTGGLAAVATDVRRVLLLVYEPRNPVTNVPLWQEGNYQDPYALTAAAVDWWKETSSGRLEYRVVDTLRYNAFPRVIDGFQYTYPTWETVMSDPTQAHKPDQADYEKIIADSNLCGRANAGEVDELWLFGAPYFGFAESALAGRNGFAYNGPAFEQNSCAKLVPIMGFNYERGLPELLHDFGHRAEATMTQVFGGWAEDRMGHDWDRFGLVAVQSPSFGISGCGSVHYPPNASIAYEYDRHEATSSYCRVFSGYPTLPADLASHTVPVDCTAWDCTEDGFLRYWFRHLPRATGTRNGISNDWWAYFIDPNRAKGCGALATDICATEQRCSLWCNGCFRRDVNGEAACSACGLERTLESCDAHGGCAWYSCGSGFVNCWPAGTDPAVACSG